MADEPGDNFKALMFSYVLVHTFSILKYKAFRFVLHQIVLSLTELKEKSNNIVNIK